ncbi:MAG: ABC transporter permease [Fimbriimonadales bacterium]
MSRYRWTGRDVAVLLAVAIPFGLVYIAWDHLYNWLLEIGWNLAPTSLINGMWMMGGFLAAALIRKPGACLLGEALSALVEVGTIHLVGAQYPINVSGEVYTRIEMSGRTMEVFNVVFFVGILQGVGGELALGLYRYDNWNYAPFLWGGVGAAVMEWLTGIYVTHYYAFAGTSQLWGTLVTSVIAMMWAGALSCWIGQMVWRDRFTRAAVQVSTEKPEGAEIR